MHDPTVLVVNLVYASTVGIGFLMFLGHVAAFIVLLASAATAKLLTNALRALASAYGTRQLIRNSAVAISRGSRLPLIPSTVKAGAGHYRVFGHRCRPYRSLTAMQACP